VGDSNFDAAASDGRDDGGTAARIIYILYLAGLIVGVTPLIGLVMAYIFRDGAPTWLRTHYRYQIRTFWIGFLYVVIGAVTSFILIGYLVLLFWLIWYIVRCVKGLRFLATNQGVPHPGSWMF
jgi:uncharacterized membrane protein